MTPQQKASWDALVKQLKRNRKKRNRPYYNAIRLSIRILWSYESWKHDIKIRIAQLNAKEQISKLNKAKSILESYMSHDDRLAMALKEIKEMGI